MKTEKYYDVRCEECGFHLSTDYHRGMSQSRVQAVKWAFIEGFKVVDGKTLCPDCIRNLKEKNSMFMYDPIGKTLAEVARDCGVSYQGYSVFTLQDDEDTIGVRLDDDISIELILRKYPEYKDCVVKYENDFFGTTVLRVNKPN